MSNGKPFQRNSVAVALVMKKDTWLLAYLLATEDRDGACGRKNHIGVEGLTSFLLCTEEVI